MLQSKLSNNGITLKILKGIEAWLAYRTQQVMLDGVSSVPAPVKPTILHGTV